IDCPPTLSPTGDCRPAPARRREPPGRTPGGLRWNCMPPRSAFLDKRIHVLGGSLPMPVALLIGATLVSSILGAQVQGLAEGGALAPAFILKGEAWRLVTWAFFEMNPLGLIFGALALFWFGSDLVRLWGPGRFLATYLGLAAAAAGVTCLLALAFSRLM